MFLSFSNFLRRNSYSQSVSMVLDEFHQKLELDEDNWTAAPEDMHLKLGATTIRNVSFFQSLLDAIKTLFLSLKKSLDVYPIF